LTLPVPSGRSAARALIPSLLACAAALSPAARAADASRTAGAPINTVDTIVDDMRKMNDLRLAGIPDGYGWSRGPGHVIMGNDARGSHTPGWWNPADRHFKSDAWWKAMVPWIVIFDGVGNGAWNTRVALRAMKAYYKSRSSGRWVLLGEGPVDGYNYPKSLQGSSYVPTDRREESSGTASVRPPGGNVVFHGWCCNAPDIPAADIAAIHVTLQARLIVDDASRTDDRWAARYLLQVGGDYYPDRGTRVEQFAPTSFNPGIGLSRSKLVSDQWQAFSFTTLDVGVSEPGGGTISEAELRKAPPPLD
jgi:hypothetical protein